MTKSIQITAPILSHLIRLTRGLVQTGWDIVESPDMGRLARNGQRIVLRTAKLDTRFRIFVYKVTQSSRGKPEERRIEITSTYPKGLARARKYSDVVLGFDFDHDIFVGVDPRRIEEGGRTGNASSFFDKENLGWSRRDEILIRPRAAKLFPGGMEFHAFIKPPRLAEYLLNLNEIHTGSYTGHGLYSGEQPKRQGGVSLQVARASAQGELLVLSGPRLSRVRPRISNALVKAFEQGKVKRLRRAKLTPEQLLDIKRRCEENGYLGEEHVLNYERRRLRAKGKNRLASRIRWVSKESVSEGFDILSFELNGAERWIEVKASAQRSRIFEMSENEWQTAKSGRSKYHIYRVTEVRTKPNVKIYRDPVQLEEEGMIQKSPSGWWVKLI
jgi:hypothetical protein